MIKTSTFSPGLKFLIQENHCSRNVEYGKNMYYLNMFPISTAECKKMTNLRTMEQDFTVLRKKTKVAWELPE